MSLNFISQRRDIPPDFLGVNGDGLTTDLMGRVWNDPDLPEVVRRLHPGNIRIFGGTSANLWGWRQGRVIRSLPELSGYRAGAPSQSISLNTLLNVTRVAGASPLFDLNMVSSTLSDQIAMLRAARELGVPIKRVELGNELYSAPYSSVFADGAAYGRVANQWIAALHREFPGVLVAVDAASPGMSNDVRRVQWNRKVFATVRGEDAATIHHYFTPGPRTTGQHGTDAQTQVEAPTVEWGTRMLPALASIPRSLPVWVTEWNYRDSVDPSTLTWARALGNVEFAVRLAANDRIDLADYHSMIDGGFVGFGALTASESGDQDVRYAFRADGVALRALLATLDGCTQVRAVGTESSTTSGPKPTLAGLSCAATRDKPLILVNPTGNSMSLDVSEVEAGSSVTVRTFAANPSGSGAGLTSRAASTPASSVEVPPWSLVNITSRD